MDNRTIEEIRKNETLLIEEIKRLIEEMINANIGIDVGSGYSKQGYMKER